MYAGEFPDVVQSIVGITELIVSWILLTRVYPELYYVLQVAAENTWLKHPARILSENVPAYHETCFWVRGCLGQNTIFSGQKEHFAELRTAHHRFLLRITGCQRRHAQTTSCRTPRPLWRHSARASRRPSASAVYCLRWPYSGRTMID